MEDVNGTETNELEPLIPKQSNHSNNSINSSTLTTVDKTRRNKGEYSPPAKTDITSVNILPNDGSNTIETNTNTKDKNDDVMKYSRPKQILLFTIMLLVNVLGPLSTEAQVPALQDIAIDLSTTSQWVQLTITIYMLSFGASQLFFGTLSDMYGRRNTLIAGLVIYVATNAGCALSPNIAALNIFRAVQAMGSGM